MEAHGMSTLIWKDCSRLFIETFLFHLPLAVAACTFLHAHNHGREQPPTAVDRLATRFDRLAPSVLSLCCLSSSKSDVTSCFFTPWRCRPCGDVPEPDSWETSGSDRSYAHLTLLPSTVRFVQLTSWSCGRELAHTPYVDIEK